MGRTMERDLGRGMRAVSVSARLEPHCPQNDAIKTALLLAERLPELLPETREWARCLGRAFPGVALATIAEGRGALRAARLHRNNSGYRRALFWARLILNASRAQEGEIRVEDPLDRKLINRAFELFVRKGLVETIGAEARVERSRFHWNCNKRARSPMEPIMETDVTIFGPDRCMVVDAKYYKNPFIEHLRGGERIRSAHLYQVASYLRALRQRDPHNRPWSACLVYARKDGEFDYRVDLGDFELRALGIAFEAEPVTIINRLARIW